MGELRIILLIIGALVLLALYFFSKPRGGPQARERDQGDNVAGADPAAESAGPSRDRPADREPEQETLSLELERLGQIISHDRKQEQTPGARASAPEPRPDRGGPAPEPPRQSDAPSPPPEPPEKVVVVYVRARRDESITGPDLQKGARMLGMEYGFMDIYHRLDQTDSRAPIFSLANMTPPGTLEHAQSEDFATPGVTLFMQLPGPVSGVEAVDAMLAAAKRLGQLWHAEVLDDNRSTLTRQRIQQLHEEMRAFDRRHAAREIDPNDR